MKTLIFLFDGTANDASSDTYSNVYTLNQLISENGIFKEGRKKTSITQVTFYLPGVGTSFTVVRPARKGFFSWFRGDVVRQQIFGDGLEQMVLRAYVNLCSNYQLGDRIVLIGFSRGAAAARIFSRLISDFGILTAEKLKLLDKIWNEFIEISKNVDDSTYFCEIKKVKNELSEIFKGQIVFYDEKSTVIDFLGVFDTVIGSVDDQYVKNLTMRDPSPASKVVNIVHLMSMHDVRKTFELKRFVPRTSSEGVFREIWLPGVHSDIGGGYLEDLIGNISLLTMADLLAAYGGVSLDQFAYKQVVARIREAYVLGPMKINREPVVGILRESRARYVRATDEIHPLHWHLCGKNVYWKDIRSPVEYQNFYPQNQTNTNLELHNSLKYWLGPTRAKRRDIFGTQSS